MSVRRIIVIGASSGGIEALRTLLAGLPPDLPAAVCVVLHMSPESPGMLEAILGRAGKLRVAPAGSGARLEQGCLYVARPDHHMIVEPGAIRLTRGPQENRFRPAIDPLFRSAAQVYGPSAIGVILTGSLDDGTSGLWAIKRLGGVALVQDPADAMFPSMPMSAIRHVDVDYTVPLAQIAPLLTRLAAAPAEKRDVAVPPSMEIEVKIAKETNAVDAGVMNIGHPSSFACPDCHGVLLELPEGQPLRFRCHTGHAYSMESLIAAVNDRIEEALWTAMRSLEEGSLLLRRVSRHLHTHADQGAARHVESQADEVKEHANAVRQVASTRRELTVPPADAARQLSRNQP